MAYLTLNSWIIKKMPRLRQDQQMLHRSDAPGLSSLLPDECAMDDRPGRVIPFAR